MTIYIQSSKVAKKVVAAQHFFALKALHIRHRLKIDLDLLRSGDFQNHTTSNLERISFRTLDMDQLMLSGITSPA